MPRLVTPEPKRIERYLFGLAPQIRSMVTSARPAMIRDAIDMAFSLTKDAIRIGTLSSEGPAVKGSDSKVAEDKPVEGSVKKGKFYGKRKRVEKNDRSAGSSKKVKAFAATDGQRGNVFCNRCRKPGHKEEVCRSPPYGPSGRTPWWSYGSKDHWRKDCPKANQQARGRAFVIGRAMLVKTPMLLPVRSYSMVFRLQFYLIQVPILALFL